MYPKNKAHIEFLCCFHPDHADHQFLVSGAKNVTARQHMLMRLLSVSAWMNSSLSSACQEVAFSASRTGFVKPVLKRGLQGLQSAGGVVDLLRKLCKREFSCCCGTWPALTNSDQLLTVLGCLRAQHVMQCMHCYTSFTSTSRRRS